MNKHFNDNIHKLVIIDYETMTVHLYDNEFLKKNYYDTDWKEDWGGGFHWDGKDYYAPPGSFMLFNPRIPHKAGDIYCEKKRFAVDYTVASSTPYVLQSPYN